MKLKNEQIFYVSALIMLLAFFINSYLNMTYLTVLLYFASTFLMAIGIFKHEYKRYFFGSFILLFVISIL